MELSLTDGVSRIRPPQLLKDARGGTEQPRHLEHLPFTSKTSFLP